MTDHAGFMRLPARCWPLHTGACAGTRIWQSSPGRRVVERWLVQARLRQLAVLLQRIVSADDLIGRDARFGLASRQVMVCGIRAPLRHQLVAAALLNRFRN